MNNINRQGHIFLSYRGLEADFALRLAADLKNAGVRLWMDRLDIAVGMNWRDAIQQAINDCVGMIAVLSPDYVESEYCKKEIARADTLKRPIFPILLHTVGPELWPYVIQGVQYEDFTGWPDERVYRERLSKLLHRLRSEAGDQIGPTPDTETRYLTSLIAELESRRGVLEYVELGADADAPPDIRPKPPMEDEWGFALLVQSFMTARPDQSETIPLKGISEATRDYPRFVLVGEPGSGKTTTIRRLVLDAAKRRLDNPRTAHLPLLAYLPQWSNEPTPLDFVCRQWPLAGDLGKLLRAGEVALYLDGLNEMGESGQNKVELLNNWFRSPDAPARVIVTCRTADYKEPLRLDTFPTILTQELTENQIELFVEKYLKDRAGNFRYALIGDISRYESEHSLFKLARNPYLLSALIVLYETTGELPRNAGAVFRGLCHAIWKRERLRGMAGWVPYEQVLPGIAQLAYGMIDGGLPVDVPMEYVMAESLNPPLVRLAVSAGFITSTNQRLRFFHQMFQEYFAAEAIEAKIPDSMETLRSHITNPRWSDVILMLAGITDHFDWVLNAVVADNPVLAAKCLAQRSAQSGAVVRETVDRIVDAIWQMTKDGNWPECRRVTDIFADLRLSESIPYLEKLLHYDHPEVRWGAIHALREIGDSRGGASLVESLKDPAWANRGEACVTLAELQGDLVLSDIVQLLQDSHAYVRGRACYAIYLAISKAGRIERKDYLLNPPDAAAEVFNWILSLVRATDFWSYLQSGLSSDNLRIVEASLNILVEKREIGNRGGIIAALSTLLAHEDAFIRAGAMQAFGRLQIYEKIARIVEIMQTDDKSVVRETASVALKMLNAKQAVPSMIKQLRTDKVAGVKRRILLSLIEMRVPSAVSDVLFLLDDTDADVRGLACRYLGEFGDDTVAPRLAPLQFDKERAVREAASAALTFISSMSLSGSVDSSSRSLRHVGIIPDGNRRWAKQHKMEFEQTYWLAMQKLAMCIDRLFAHDVFSVSAYLLSKDNILRARNDLEAVVQAELRLLQELLPVLKAKHKLKIYHAGNPCLLPNEYQSALSAICETDNDIDDSVRRLYLCAGYDPLDELECALKGKNFSAELVISSLSVPTELDAVIRTGGDIRMSGFLPLQCKYAELFFEPYYFPDISEERIDRICAEFASRPRRFGR